MASSRAAAGAGGLLGGSVGSRWRVGVGPLGQRVQLPRAVGVGVEPALGVGAAQLDQGVGELRGEEQVAEQFAAVRVGAGVEQLAE